MNININPVAFSIGDLSIRWYGVMVALGVMVVILWTLRAVRNTPISYDTVFTAALVGIPSGIIVSRLLHVIDLWPSYYSQHPAQIFGVGGLQGLTIWGAVLGAALGIWVWGRFAHFKTGHLFDLVAPGIVLGQSIGRVGCTINGCCYGAETDSPLGVIYTNLDSYAPLGIKVHPTQIYEIVFLLATFGILLAVRKRLKPHGALFLVYLSLYSVWRFGIGFLRVGTVFALGLEESQVISLIVLAIAIPVLVTQLIRARNEPAAEPEVIAG